MTVEFCAACKRPHRWCCCAEIATEIAEARANDSTRAERVVRLREPDEPQRPVPCRECGETVMLSEFAWLMAQKAGEMLARRGEPPLEDGELTMCAPCGKEWRAKEAAASQEVHERAIGMIRDARKTGKLGPYDADWLTRNGFGDSVSAMRERFARQADNATKRGGKQRALEDVE